MTRGRLDLSDIIAETLSVFRDIGGGVARAVGGVFKAILITLAWSVLIVLFLTHATATFPAAVTRKAKPC